MDFDFTKQPGRSLLERELNRQGTPLVSVITPYYNAGAHFEQTFRCVMNQTFPWFEWIIVDDGSTEPADIDLLEQLALQDGRVRTLHTENAGPAAARNRAARESTADILIPLDADDLIAPTFVETLYWALHHHPEAGWAYTDSCGFGEQEYLWRKEFSSERMKTENLLVCTAALRKSAFDGVGGYPEEKGCHEDWLFWLRLLERGEYPVHVKGTQFWYRRSNQGKLQNVEGDKTLRRRSKRLIAQAARKVRSEVSAVEYPRGTASGMYPAPVCSDWERKVFKNHDKISVLMLLPWMEMGGADRFNLDVCRLLDKEHFEIGILTTQVGENRWQQRFEEHVTDIFNLPDFLDMANWAEFISYFIRSRGVDVLFLSNSYYGYYLAPWLRKQFPELAIVDYVHMEEWYWRNGGYARTSGAVGEILEKTLVCNESTRRVMTEHFGRKAETVETLYIGVDREEFDPDEVETGLARTKLGIAPGRPVILFPCRLHPQKRPFLMVEIAKKLRKILPDVAFVVAGDGPQLEELRFAIRQEGLGETIYLAGRQSDLRPFYRDSDVTLICSLKEGLALTAYESLSMGTPVVTSDVGGQAELVDGTVGRVLPLLQREGEELNSRSFPSGEVEQYVSAIVDLLSDRSGYEACCKACRTRIEEGFSTQVMADKLAGHLRRLVENEDLKKARREKSETLRSLGRLADDYCTAFCEVESHESGFRAQYSGDRIGELMRMANSKWGRRLIKLAWKLKLNRLF